MQMSAVVKQANNGVKSNKAFCPDIDIVDMDNFVRPFIKSSKKQYMGNMIFFLLPWRMVNQKNYLNNFIRHSPKLPFLKETKCFITK